MSLTRAHITGVGHYVPDYILTNKELETLVDTNDEWIRSRTGIVERRILKDPDKATSYMAAKAAEKALEDAGIGAEERSEEHTSELQSRGHLVCRLLLEKQT